MAPAAVLGPDLALAAAAAPSRHVVAALSGVDPLRLDLPPLPGLRIAPEALRTLSALYLAARLEDAGVLPAAEALVAQRAVLRVPVSTAARLEDLARRHQQFVPAAQRAVLFARLFGAGPAAGAGSAVTAAGARFEPHLAALCSALVEYGRGPLGATNGARTAVELAARDLAALAGQVVGGGATLAVPRLNDHLRRAIALLSDPGIGALVGARGPWETLRALLGPDGPDLRRLIDCGRNGQRVLVWLSGMITAPAGGGPPIGIEVVTSAATWLSACGLPPRTRGEGSI